MRFLWVLLLLAACAPTPYAGKPAYNCSGKEQQVADFVLACVKAAGESKADADHASVATCKVVAQETFCIKEKTFSVFEDGSWKVQDAPCTAAVTPAEIAICK